jgi:hypothetical protein
MITALEIYLSHKEPVSKIKKVDPNKLWEDHLEKKNAPRSKYGNKWVVIDNIKFQSTGEGNFYLELKDRQRRGDIKEFKRQVPFEFVIDGIRIGKYITDFVVLNYDGTLDVIDYKSRFTAVMALYLMKKQLMMVCYQVLVREAGVQKINKKVPKKVQQ